MGIKISPPISKPASKSVAASQPAPPKAESLKMENLLSQNSPKNTSLKGETSKDGSSKKEHRKEENSKEQVTTKSSFAGRTTLSPRIPMNVVRQNVKILLPPNLAKLVSQITVATKTGTTELKVSEDILPATSVIISHNQAGKVMVTINTSSPVAIQQINANLKQLKNELPKGVELKASLKQSKEKNEGHSRGEYTEQ